MDDEQEVTLQITIPFPYEIARTTGLDSVRGPNGVQINFRALMFEDDKFAEAASVIGLTKSEYMRRVLNDASDVILEMNRIDFKPLQKYKVRKAAKNV